MRQSTFRTGKYRAKVRGLVLPFQTARFRTSVQGQVSVENVVKTVLAEASIQPILNHFYMDFGKKIVQLKGRHKGDILEKEAQILIGAWRDRGLDEETLIRIKEIYIPVIAAPPVNWFIMDSSILDGPDVLA